MSSVAAHLRPSPTAVLTAPSLYLPQAALGLVTLPKACRTAPCGEGRVKTRPYKRTPKAASLRGAKRRGNPFPHAPAKNPREENLPGKLLQLIHIGLGDDMQAGFLQHLLGLGNVIHPDDRVGVALGTGHKGIQILQVNTRLLQGP